MNNLNPMRNLHGEIVRPQVKLPITWIPIDTLVNVTAPSGNKTTTLHYISIALVSTMKSSSNQIVEKKTTMRNLEVRIQVKFKCTFPSRKMEIPTLSAE